MRNFNTDNIKINTSEAIIVDSKGEIIDLMNCITVREVKNKIIEEFIPLCRKCSFARFCKFYEKDEHCPLQVKFMNNYLDSTIRFIPKNRSVYIKEYLDYLIHLLKLLERFNNWQGGILDENCLKWQGEEVLNFDKYWFKKINLELAHVIDKYLFIQPSEKHFYRFKVFVEGKDDKRVLENIIWKVGFYIGEEYIETLKGEGEVKNTIKYIQKLISEGFDIFFLMDNEGNWYKVVKKRLINTNLINEREQVFKFKKALEDSYPWQVQKEAFLKLNMPDDIKQQSNDNFFRNAIKGKSKIVDILQCELSKYKINFKKDYKEKFNQFLLKIFLMKKNIQKSHCGLIQTIKQLIKSINLRRDKFYINR